MHNQRNDDGDEGMAECLKDLCDLAFPAEIVSELMDLEVVMGTAKTRYGGRGGNGNSRDHEPHRYGDRGGLNGVLTQRVKF